MRRYVSDVVGDLITGTFASGTSTTGVHAMLRKGDDYYNDHGYRCYIYDGTNIGEEREVSDWTLTTPANTLTFAPAFTAAIDNTSKYELHYIFTESEYRKAINIAIDDIAGKYLVDLKDETTIRLTSAEDNLEGTVYTWEYALPTSFLYLTRVITEEAVGGIKLTGTVSDTFTANEIVEGGTSGATGELAYSGSTYIRLRKVSGTFVVGETATGATSGETCSTITAVDGETSGGGRFLSQDIIDQRSYSIIKSYPPKLKLDERYYTIDEDLYLRLEGHGTQPIVDDDTDTIAIPTGWLINRAIASLPENKIQSNQLENIYRHARLLSERMPENLPGLGSRRIVE